VNGILTTFEDYLEGSKWRKTLLLFLVILLAMALRLIFISLPNYDYTECFLLWYDQFLKVGRLDAFKEMFFNYSPALLYLIDIMTLFRSIPGLIAVKLIPIAFDFLAAAGVMQIVKIKYPKGAVPLAAFSMFLFLPTVFLVSSMWGQFDSIFSSFLVWCFYFLLKRRNWLAMLSFSIAFCFKLQAVFFGPVLLLLLLRKKIPFFQFFLIPVIFFVSVIPAWLAGGPLDQLLLAYASQFGNFSELSKAAPNLYSFLPATPPGYTAIVWTGLGIALIVTLGYVYLRWRKWMDLGDISLSFDAAFFTLFVPFLLPKMHDRYFFTACVFLFILFFFEPRTVGLTLLGQVSSTIAYIVFLTDFPEVFTKIAAIFTMLLVIRWIWHFKEHLVRLKRIPNGVDG
jgi:Gpi18-like mannosyltransferase